MIIWTCLVIPFLAAIVLYYFWPHKILWWEIALPMLASLLFILIAKFSIEHFQTSDTEFWTGYVVETQYYESWTEQYTTTVTTTDSKGRSHTRVEVRTRFHPAEYYVIDNNGIKCGVNSSCYRQLQQRFKNETKKSLFHSGKISWGDGDMFYSTYPNDRNLMEVCTTTHSYENRVKVSKSIFNFPKVTDPEQYKLYEYPEITGYYDAPSILNQVGVNAGAANIELCRRNAEIGHSKQVRMWILLFKSQPIDAALQQQAYWVNGNKNDFVLCIGCDDAEKVNWAYAFSWCENEQLKAEVKNFAQSQTQLDLNSIVNHMSDQVVLNFKRKEFKDFNYLSVEPPLWTVILSFVLTVLINIGVALWVVKNEFEEYVPEHNPYSRRHRHKYGR